ncbi:autoinducer binding domain-containing protein [Burkholderia sp. LMG 21824]|uniref:autoinducer binding domain-containing protein n=1 Tax=Burkholderia sp. LMG 21824 TaxID=3158172 RepID=UPI003C2EE9F4
MLNWQEDLLELLGGSQSIDEILRKVEKATKELGFEYCAYGMKQPLPLTQPKIITISNYPKAWQDHYKEKGYIAIDPTIKACRQSGRPVIWSDELFQSAPAMWEEAQAHDLRVGWAQVVMDKSGTGGMLTLARSREPLTAAELEANDTKRRWLAHITHLVMSTSVLNQTASATANLTEREIEVLRWAADGKTSADISAILTISDNTVNFHIKNAVAKLGAANKTAAVVKAALLGYLC